MAEIEAQIYRLIEILGEQREMTRDNVERKQARTEDERIEDEDDEFVEEEEEGFYLKLLFKYLIIKFRSKRRRG